MTVQGWREHKWDEPQRGLLRCCCALFELFKWSALGVCLGMRPYTLKAPFDTLAFGVLSRLPPGTCPTWWNHVHLKFPSNITLIFEKKFTTKRKKTEKICKILMGLSSVSSNKWSFVTVCQATISWFRCIRRKHPSLACYLLHFQLNQPFMKPHTETMTNMISGLICSKSVG